MKKKKKRIISVAFVIIILIAVLTFVWFRFRDRNVYTLSLPISDNLVSIVCEEKDGVVTKISKEEEVREFYDIVSSTDLETDVSSDYDYPQNASDVITINFNYDSGEVVVFYFYKRKNKYYFEQPYNGIYKLKKENYEKINKMIKN